MLNAVSSPLQLLGVPSCTTEDPYYTRGQGRQQEDLVF